MRPLALWGHEVRRAGWTALLAPLAAAGLLVAVAVDGAARLDQPSRSTALVLQSLLELALPLAAGVGAANLVGRDPAVELQLTLPTAYRATILRRLVVTAGWAAVTALAVAAAMVASGWWHRWPEAHPALAGQLTWLAPTLCLSGLGLLAGALSASPALATSVVAALWVFQYAAAGPLQDHRWSRLLYLFATHPRHGRPGLGRQPPDPAGRRRGDDLRRVAAAAPPQPAAHQGDGMTGFAGAARYELLMQLRNPAIWIATVLPFGLYALFAVLGQDSTGLARHRLEADPKAWIVEALGWFIPVMPMVFGIVLADRLVRDRRLRVAELLAATPTGGAARLVGKYLGCCAATAAPAALVYLVAAAAFTVWHGRPAALWWALAAFTLLVVPLLLLVGSLSFLGPQLMPAPLFRVLVVAVWFWAGVTEVESQVPSLAGTLLSLTMDYPLKVFFASPNATTDPAGAALDFLRPRATVGTALLSLALILALAAAILAAARALNARTGE